MPIYRLILHNCNLVDVRRGEVREKVAIGIEGGRIQSVKEAGQIQQGSAVDLNGLYVLPSLFNVHAHLSLVFPPHRLNRNETPAMTALRCYRRGLDALRAGVTTVRTVGELHRADIALRSMINEGWVDGPRIISAGRAISTTGGHGSGFGAIEADGADGFRRAAREELAAGADHIKIFITGGIGKRGEGLGEPQATPQEIEAAVSVASSKGTYVCAHAGGSEPIKKAVEAGVRSFEHCYGLDQDAARAIRKINGYIVPTLSVTHLLEWYRQHEFEEWIIERARAARDNHLESIRTAIRAGVKLVNGTDMSPGDTVDGVNVTVREAEFMVEAGLSPLEAIRACTLYAAELCKVDGQVGVIEPGYRADLIVVPNNPLKNIQSLRGIVYVMQDGGVVLRNL